MKAFLFKTSPVFTSATDAETRRPDSPEAQTDRPTPLLPDAVFLRRCWVPEQPTRCCADGRSCCSDAAVKEWRCCFWLRPTPRSARDTDVAVPLLIHGPCSYTESLCAFRGPTCAISYTVKLQSIESHFCSFGNCLKARMIPSWLAHSSLSLMWISLQSFNTSKQADK